MRFVFKFLTIFLFLSLENCFWMQLLFKCVLYSRASYNSETTVCRNSTTNSSLTFRIRLIIRWMLFFNNNFFGPIFLKWWKYLSKILYTYEISVSYFIIKKAFIIFFMHIFWLFASLLKIFFILNACLKVILNIMLIE